MAISTHVYGSEMIGKNMEPKQDDMLHSRLYAILEQSLNEIYVFDTQTLRFSYVNRFAQRNLGYSADELAEMTPLQINPEFDEVFFRGMADSLLKGQNENLVFETQHLRANGTLYPVEVHLQRFAQPGREEFLAIVLDITTRRRAEAALRDSEMRFRTMANTIPQLAWIAKTDGSRSWYNQRWYDYTGTNRGEALGWGWQKFHDPEGPASGHPALDRGGFRWTGIRHGISIERVGWKLSYIPDAGRTSERCRGQDSAVVRHEH